MVDNVALQVKPLEIQPNTGFVNSLLAASQIKNANTQNDLAQFGLQQKQGEQNALAEYSKRQAAGDENPLAALREHPETMARMATTQHGIEAGVREKNDWVLQNKGRYAASILALPEDQQEPAFRAGLPEGIKQGWMNQLEYQAALSKPFDRAALQQIAYRALGPEKTISLVQSQQDRKDLKDSLGQLPGHLEPPPGQVVSQGGGSAVGGIPSFGQGARIVGYDQPPGAAGPPAAPGVAPASAPAPYAPLPERAPLDPYAKAIVNVMSQPGAPEGLKAGLKSVLDQHLKNSEPTNPIKNYRVYQQQGGTASFTDWDRANKQAGATSINTAEGEAAAQTKGRIEIDKAAIKDMAEKNAKSASAIPLLQHVLQISKNTPAGYAGAVAPTVAKIAATLGIPVTEGMSNAELFNSITRQLVPGVRDPGSASNLEQQMYQAALPNASQSAEGREKIANMFIKMQKRDQEVVKLYRDNLGSPDLSKKMEELSNKPLFAPEEMQWLEQNAKVPDLNKPAQPARKTSTGVTWGP